MMQPHALLPGMRGRPGRLGRAGLALAGCVMLCLGIAGAFVPLMPTTVFLILTAWCFGRSSPRLEAWLLSHPRLGPVICDWREHGAIPRRAKWLACGSMAAGLALFVLTARPGPMAALAGGAMMAACGGWICMRPERAGDRQ